MTYKQVQCIIRDARFEENIPEEGSTYDPYIEIIYEITKSEEPHDVGLLFKSVLFEEELRQLVGLSRALSSKEMIHFVQQLNKRVEPFVMIIDADNELVTSEMLMLDQIPQNNTIKPLHPQQVPLHERIEKNHKTNKRWNYKKDGDLPIGNINYADTDDKI